MKQPLRLADAKEISTDAAVAAVLSELDGISTIKEEHRMILMAFFKWTQCFLLPPDWIWREYGETQQYLAR